MSDQKTLTRVKSLARCHTENAINVLQSIMMQEECPPAARVSAAQVLLDRGWGKPAQPQTGEDGEGAISIVHEVRRTIIDPKTA